MGQTMTRDATESGSECAPSELLTADELAEALKVSTASVRLWQRQGVPHVPIGRLKRYMLHEVIEWHANDSSCAAYRIAVLMVGNA